MRAGWRPVIERQDSLSSSFLVPIQSPGHISVGHSFYTGRPDHPQWLSHGLPYTG